MKGLTAMTFDEKRIEELEESFPSLSGSAFSRAFRQTLDSGLSVLVSDKGFIYEVFPNGTRKKIKKIEAPTVVELGKKITLP